MFKQGFTPIALVVAVLILLAAGAGIILWQQTKLPAAPAGEATPPPVPSGVEGPAPEVVATTTGADTTNWQTYRNDEYGFELSYPSTASVSEINNPRGISILEGYVDKHFEIFVNYDWESRIQELKNNPYRRMKFIRQETAEINGVKGKKFIFGMQDNDCTISYVLLERARSNFFLDNLAECPTHAEGVDKQMLDIVNTFKIL